jgi:hypothetical protein
MENWKTFKIILQGDLEAWNHFVSQLSLALEKEKDVLLRKGIKETLGPLMVYQEVTKHYLEIMESMETGTYSLGARKREDTLDGGTTEKLI